MSKSEKFKIVFFDKINQDRVGISYASIWSVIVKLFKKWSGDSRSFNDREESDSRRLPPAMHILLHNNCFRCISCPIVTMGTEMDFLAWYLFVALSWSRDVSAIPVFDINPTFTTETADPADLSKNDNFIVQIKAINAAGVLRITFSCPVGFFPALTRDSFMQGTFLLTHLVMVSTDIDIFNRLHAMHGNGYGIVTVGFLKPESSPV